MAKASTTGTTITISRVTLLPYGNMVNVVDSTGRVYDEEADLTAMYAAGVRAVQYDVTTGLYYVEYAPIQPDKLTEAEFVVKFGTDAKTLVSEASRNAIVGRVVARLEKAKQRHEELEKTIADDIARVAAANEEAGNAARNANST